MDTRYTGFPWIADDDKTDFAPPAVLHISLWRSLLLNFRDRAADKNLPPLDITSRPVDLGMLPGDQMELPWYRSIFTNIGDVVSPETLPPLQLESLPVDMGELIGDQLQHGWWSSLLRSLADKFAPEETTPLHLTSAPVTPESSSATLQVPRWSALIEAPRYAAIQSRVDMAEQEQIADPWGLSSASVKVRISYPGPFAGPPVALAVASSSVDELIRKARRALHLAYAREAVWMGAAAAETGFLLFWLIGRR
jgi:hypothetical protein